METWKNINDTYQVSSEGRVFSKKTKRLLAGYKQNGKQYFQLGEQRVAADRLVLEHFKTSNLPNVVHLDGQLDNDCKNNLKQSTRGDLMRYYNTLRGKKRGVYKYKHGEYQYFRAVLKINEQVKTLGYFKTRLEAEMAYMEGYKKAYGYYPLGA